MNNSALLITRGSKGMSLFEGANCSPLHIPAVARNIYDVTGAGDTVVAVMALSLASGATLVEAACLSNYAAGLAVEQVGTVAVSLDDLVRALS